MKSVIRSFVCGNSNWKDNPEIHWCFPGDKNCNNYCNHDHSKPMAERPKTFETIVWEERDMWKDVIEEIAGWNPSEKHPTVYDFLLEKYSIKFKPSTK